MAKVTSIFGFKFLYIYNYYSVGGQQMSVLYVPWLDMALLWWMISINCVSDKVLHSTWTKYLNLCRWELELGVTFIFLHQWTIYFLKTNEKTKRQFAGTEKKISTSHICKDLSRRETNEKTRCHKIKLRENFKLKIKNGKGSSMMSKTYLDIVSGKICISQVEITEEICSQ